MCIKKAKNIQDFLEEEKNGRKDLPRHRVLYKDLISNQDGELLLQGWTFKPTEHKFRNNSTHKRTLDL